MRYNSMPKGEAFFIIEGNGALDLFMLDSCSELSRMEIKTKRYTYPYTCSKKYKGC